ncbi:MAG: CopG family transcriptional regulator [Candidatus Aenigmatarchaeota archaeon]
MQVNVSDKIAEKLKERVKTTQFDNLDDYVNYILEQVVRKLEGSGLTKGDEEKVKERLRSLGYLE